MSDKMSTALSVFENTQFGSVRVVMRNGEPWFIAKDVCDCLGLDNVSRATNGLDEDEKVALEANITNSNVGGRGTIIISEAGLYSLILRSRKPEAKEFKRWVTHEVLPSIRKTGQFAVGQPAPIVRPLSDVAFIFQCAGIEGNQLALALDKLYRAETGRSALTSAEVVLVAPKQEQLCTPTEIGRMLTPVQSPKQVNRLLNEMGYQYRTGDKWNPTSDGKAAGAVLLDTNKRHSDGTPVRQLKWAASIIEELQAELDKE